MNTPSVKSLCLEIFDNKCCYCGIKLDLSTKYNPDSFSRDHFLPKCRGHKTKQHLNILPSCRTCNNKKGKLHPSKFLSKEHINDIMTYFNYVYYLLKRYRLRPLEEIRQEYNSLWSWMNEFTDTKKIEVKALRRKKGKRKCQNII